jgi:Arc/MetJ family transcription regulator
MLDRDTGAVIEKTLKHEGAAVREFYASIPPPVVVGIEATGSMGWFLRLMEELAIECRVGHPTAIRKAETRRQKHDRRDAALFLQLLAEDRFRPSGCRPRSTERSKQDIVTKGAKSCILICMRTTLILDPALVSRAQELSGIREKTAVIHEALRALVARESARRLAALGGADPRAAAPPRRRPAK